jgi:hypothetical protein
MPSYRSGILRVDRVDLEDREKPDDELTCEVAFSSTNTVAVDQCEYFSISGILRVDRVALEDREKPDDELTFEYFSIDGQSCGLWNIGDRFILSIDPYEGSDT